MNFFRHTPSIFNEKFYFCAYEDPGDYMIFDTRMRICSNNITVFFGEFQGLEA